MGGGSGVGAWGVTYGWRIRSGGLGSDVWVEDQE